MAGSLTLTNSTLEHGSSYGVYVASQTHYIEHNTFNDIQSYAVFNADYENFLVKAENNWWGESSGPSPWGDGYGINYRTCYDSETGLTYICEYYVDAIPWLGQDQVNSEDVLNEELPPDPNRNTAEMEAGVPYIEYVQSQQGFFYFGGESSDTIEIRVD